MSSQQASKKMDTSTIYNKFTLQAESTPSCHPDIMCGGGTAAATLTTFCLRINGLCNGSCTPPLCFCTLKKSILLLTSLIHPQNKYAGRTCEPPCVCPHCWQALLFRSPFFFCSVPHPCSLLGDPPFQVSVVVVEALWEMQGIATGFLLGYTPTPSLPICCLAQG